MPLRGRSQLKEQRIFFVTTSVRAHETLFVSEEKLSGLLDIIVSCVLYPHIALFGYVLMSDHFHLLVGVEKGGPQLSRLMRDIKGLSSRRLFPERNGIWQHRFDDVAIISEEQFGVKLNYIHSNPVRGGLCATPEDYTFSSAAAWLLNKPVPFVTTSLDDWRPSGEGT